MWITRQKMAIVLLLLLHVVGEERQVKNWNLKLFANKRETFGIETSVVVTMSRFTTETIVIRVSTKTYMLAYGEVSVDTVQKGFEFLYSGDIGALLQRNGIVPAMKLTYNSGFYTVIKAVFWEKGQLSIVLNGYLMAQPVDNPVSIYSKMFVSEPPACLPYLNMLSCANPLNPKTINIKYTTTIPITFFKKCKMDTTDLKWTIMDVVGQESLKVIDSNLLLTLKRYQLRFPTINRLWKNIYMIYAEGIYENKIFAGRCYLKTEQEKVVAQISGGNTRNAYYAEDLVMDGTMSRDFSKRTNERQFKVYNWNCKSKDDPSSRFCRPKISKAGRFSMPPNSLMVGCRYNFTLMVVADDDDHVSSQASQLVTITKTGSLFVAIRCIANCIDNMFNPMNKVLLQAECYNCYNLQTRYVWYLDGKPTVDTLALTMLIHINKGWANIRLEVRTNDDRVGVETMILRKTFPPKNGKCTVTPKTGIEAQTDFYVCCTKFNTKNTPVKFFYYAKRILLNSCNNCKCISNLPLDLTSIKVLICDNMLTCTTRYVKVKVSPLPNISVESPDALRKFISTPPNDIEQMKQLGRKEQILQTIQSLASRVYTANFATVLMDALSDFHPNNIKGLGKLANLTHTLAEQMSPIDDAKQIVLISSLTYMNSVFQTIYDTEMQGMLVEEPYINVTISCVTVYKIMKTLNKNILLPPQAIYDQYTTALNSSKLEQPVVDKLMDVIAGYTNEEAKKRSMIWLNSTWQTERLYRFLYLARQHGVQPDSSSVTNVGVSLEIQCFEIEPERTYEISTSDRMHEVTFLPELLQERKSSHSSTICIKVTSTIRELHWWYPEEKQPSSVLLSVHIFVDKDDFTKEIYLKKSKVKFRTVIGKYKPAIAKADRSLSRIFSARANPRHTHEEESDENEDSVAETGKYANCLKSDELETMHQVRIYRITLDPRSMVVVRFSNSTHKLQVLLTFGELPKHLRASIKKSGCSVPAKTVNTTMVLRNNCKVSNRVYLAVQAHRELMPGKEIHLPVPNGPAFYEFVFQVRSCDYWMYSLPADTQRWDSTHCMPGLEYPKKGSMHCTCSLLGTYTSYVYHVPALFMPTSGYIPVYINWYLISFYVIALILIFIWIVLLFLWHNNKPSKMVRCDMTGLEDPSNREQHDLLVSLKTGGRYNAQTTATVRIIFQTTLRTELMFTLLQDPEHPELNRNSTYIMWMRTRDIRLPTRIAIAHNNGGRYPSWFLRCIEVTDVQAQLTQVFKVQRWVRDKYLILSSSMLVRAGDNYDTDRWRDRFIAEFERQWINWGLLQPLMGGWRESPSRDSLTRAQRSCIFINKMMITFCVCICYLGQTTPETVYADREKLVSYVDVINMFFISCALTNFVQLLLEKVFLGKYCNKKNKN